MNIHTAIMLAADHIERHPEFFNFRQVSIPGDCRTPGCALGWIGFFYGADRLKFNDEWQNVLVVSQQLFGINHHDHCDHPFYQRLDAFEPQWRWESDACARALRLYAEKYHSADNQDDGNAFKRFLDIALRTESASV